MTTALDLSRNPASPAHRSVAPSELLLPLTPNILPHPLTKGKAEKMEIRIRWRFADMVLDVKDVVALGCHKGY